MVWFIKLLKNLGFGVKNILFRIFFSVLYIRQKYWRIGSYNCRYKIGGCVTFKVGCVNLKVFYISVSC